MKIIKVIAVLGLLFLGFACAYFVKCQLGIRLVRDSFLDNIPPFNFLQDRNPKHIVYSPKNNVDLLPNEFYFLQGSEIWYPLWMKEVGMTTLSYDDPRVHTTGMVITSRSTEGWGIQHKKMIQVRPGDVFDFSAFVKTSAKGIAGSISVITYDDGIKQLQWGYAMKSVTGNQNWQFVKGELTVPEGVKYLRFQLSGSGIGQTWFNDLKFNKVGNS